MVAWGGIMNDHVTGYPPRGVTESTVRFGVGRSKSQWTYFCEVEDCWAIGYSDVSADDAKLQTSTHTCPAPLRRGIVTQGKSILERMWDTADEAIDALKAGTFYLTEDMKDEKLKGFIAGIAEMISYASIPYFRIPEDVLREMQRRWKMRQKQIPWSPTPGYRWNPPLYEHVRDEGPGARTAPAERVGGGKVATKRQARAAQRAPEPPRAAMVVVTPEHRELIISSHKAGISTADLATTFGVDEARIKAIVDPAPVITGGLF